MKNIITVFTTVALVFSSTMYGEESSSEPAEDKIINNELNTPATIKQVGQKTTDGSKTAATYPISYLIAAGVVAGAIIAIAFSHEPTDLTTAVPKK